MNIRNILEQLASDVTFAEAGLSLNGRNRLETGDTCRRLLLACDREVIEPPLAAYALHLAERIRCDMLVACTPPEAVGSGTPGCAAEQLLCRQLSGLACPPEQLSVRSLPLRGDFFAGVREVCMRHRRLGMAILSCRRRPPADFKLDVPFFVYA